MYFDKEGNSSGYPFSREEALNKREKRYTSVPCELCGDKYRYAKTDLCCTCCAHRANDLVCFLADAITFELFGTYIRVIPHPRLRNFKEHFISPQMYSEIVALSEDPRVVRPMPGSPLDSSRRGLDHYIVPSACDKAGHMGLMTLDGRCAACEEERLGKKARADARRRGEKWYTPYEPCSECGQHAKRRVADNVCLGCRPDLRDGETPRQAALLAGEVWYTPTTPCPRCGQTAPRRVANGQCKGCVPERPDVDHRRSESSRMMAEHPDMIISRQDARALGLKVFRTGRPCCRGHLGWRWVSVGTCLDCVRGVPGPTTALSEK